MATRAPQRPTWRVEKQLWREGFARVDGVDEVGRGPLAGPVVAGAVVLPRTASGEATRAAWVARLRDSKQLTAVQRDEIATDIRRSCDWAIGAVSPQVVDQINILQATRLAMRRAVLALRGAPDALIVDGREVVEYAAAQRAVVAGDARCFSVAAASIVAKVWRDGVMSRLDQRFPGYGLAQNKGYATAEHRAALGTLGYSSIHRLSFQPVRAALAR